MKTQPCKNCGVTYTQDAARRAVCKDCMREENRLCRARRRAELGTAPEPVRKTYYRKRLPAGKDRYEARGREVWGWDSNLGRYVWRYNCARICEAVAEVKAMNNEKQREHAL
jgi:hypothetical protein